MHCETFCINGVPVLRGPCDPPLCLCMSVRKRAAGAYVCACICTWNCAMGSSDITCTSSAVTSWMLTFGTRPDAVRGLAGGPKGPRSLELHCKLN